jgi:uncharacterized protein (DUF1810 family)
VDDPYDLARFVDAQDAGGTYACALDELREGRKVTHWMWFIFPQLLGLGHSAMARRFAITSKGEAVAYVAHPLLGPRLIACASIVASTKGRSAASIFGEVDAHKLLSSMTLFSLSASGEPVFRNVLDTYFDGRLDDATVRILDETSRSASGSRS